MKILLTTCFALLTTILSAQSPANFWNEVQPSQVFLPENSETPLMPDEFRTFSLDFPAMVNHLRSAPAEGSAEAKSGALQIVLPMSDGTMETFKVWESSVMHPDLAARYPMLKTYAAMGIDDPTHTARLGVGLSGFHSVMLGENGGSVTVPFATHQTQFYINYSHTNFMWEGLNMPPVRTQYIPMETPGNGNVIDSTPNGAGEEISLRGGGEGNLTEMRVYQFALATTGEFASLHGGTLASVMDALVTATNALNSVLERDINIRLVLHPQNDEVVFLNASTDPYENSTLGGALLNQNEEILNINIGLQNFDVGHVFTGSCSDVGGVVSGQVCSTGKARGVTCHFSSNVVANTMSIAAHEMGHQYTAGHTFNNCPGQEGQLSSSSAWEPGSGSTILSYQGSCGSSNISGPAGVYYNGGTIQEFWDNTHAAIGSQCADVTVTTNHSPVVILPYIDNFYIPIGTPFELSADATDEDGDPMTYCWEQYNLGPSSPLGDPIGDAPIFRSFDPVTTPLRVFPKLATILANQNTIVEVLPQYTRNLTFRCTVRDNNVSEGAGGVTWQDVKFKATATAGPFKVTEPNTSGVIWKGGDEVAVTWDVADSDNDLVKCHSVNIRLSTDGGQTFPIYLATATPNDGSTTVFVPELVTTTARVRVEAAENIFFDLSNANFQIQPAENPGFTLSASPQYKQVCVPESPTVTLETGSILNFENPIALEVTGGLPAGVVVNFSANPVTPGQATTVTFDMSNVTADGAYEVTLKAVADGDTAFISLFFDLVYSDFTALGLNTPTDGVSAIGLLPAFEWDDLPQADLYDFYLSVSPGFEAGTVIDSILNIQDAFYTPDVALTESQIYFWRVRPKNECVVGEWALAHAFQTYTIACQPFEAQDVPVGIPTAGTPTIESVMPILQSGVITDMNVSVLKGNHDALPHIEVILTSPAGTDVVLFSGICGNVTAFNFGMDDESPFEIDCPPLQGLSYKPQNPLAAFIGENTLGNWSMKIHVINSEGQGGTLEKWELEFCSSLTLNNPFVVNNDTLFIPPGETFNVHNFQLLVQDIDNHSSELQFTIVEPPAHGFFALDGVPLGLGDHFRMLDIHELNLTYTNTDPNAPNDFFTFIVEDGTGGWLGTPQFNIKLDDDAIDGTDETFAQQIKVFPNPASDLLRVVLPAPTSGESAVRILDVQGRLLLAQTLEVGQAAFEVEVAGLSDGMYFLEIKTPAAVGVKKFSVVR